MNTKFDRASRGFSSEINPAEDSISRRNILRGGLLGAGAMLAHHLCAAGAEDKKPAAEPAAKAEGETAAAPPAKAKAVIQIWMWGGPPHTDTFDPKPDSGSDYTGPYNHPIQTNVKGIRIGEALPELAKVADKYSIIRTMSHGQNGHETASYLTQTGRMPDRYVYPMVGGVVSYFKGYDHGYDGLLPPYIVLTQPQGRFSEAGFLGIKYKPFATGGDPNSRDKFAVEGIVAPGVDDSQQERGRQILGRLNTLGKLLRDDPLMQTADKAQKQAYDLIIGDVGKVFDLSQEKEELRNKYGRTTFGQSCLVARRLVQRGVRYITINSMGWDTHWVHFDQMKRKLPDFDQGLAALLADLSEQGLLDSTIVWVGGEFGRTPKVMPESPWNGGRGHFGPCFSHVVAGGGFKGGVVVGESNAKGEEPKNRPVHPSLLMASMYELLGIDTNASLLHPMGERLPMIPPPIDGGKSVGRLSEIM
jgi:hypothetical protein